VIQNIVNTGYSLSQTPSIGIAKGFFNCSGVEYDIGYAFNVIGYMCRGANGCLISRVLLSKVNVWL
jgi:hypothetical protein